MRQAASVKAFAGPVVGWPTPGVKRGRVSPVQPATSAVLAGKAHSVQSVGSPTSGSPARLTLVRRHGTERNLSAVRPSMASRTPLARLAAPFQMEHPQSAEPFQTEHRPSVALLQMEPEPSVARSPAEHLPLLVEPVALGTGSPASRPPVFPSVLFTPCPFCFPRPLHQRGGSA